MNKNNHKPSGFDYEPVGKVYAPDTKVITHRDGTVSLRPSTTTNTTKKNGK